MEIKPIIPKTLGKKEYLSLAPHDQERYVESKMKDILDQNPHGITIPEIEAGTPFTRPTIIKHLERLVSCREGYKIRRGKITLYFPNGKSVYPEKVVKTEINNSDFFKGTLLRNNYGDFIYLEEDGSDSISGGGLLIKRESWVIFRDFVDKLNKNIGGN